MGYWLGQGLRIVQPSLESLCSIGEGKHHLSSIELYLCTQCTLGFGQPAHPSRGWFSVPFSEGLVMFTRFVKHCLPLCTKVFQTPSSCSNPTTFLQDSGTGWHPEDYRLLYPLPELGSLKNWAGCKFYNMYILHWV